MTDSPLLVVDQLSVEIRRKDRTVHPLQGVSFSVRPGTRTGIVGESGSGKSMSALAVLRHLPEGGVITAGRIAFDGEELLALSEQQMRHVRGRQISIVFQNAVAALNPLYSVGQQIADVYRYHEGVSKQAAWDKAVSMLDSMGIPNAAQKAKEHPHQYSGGMAQRAMIAMALVCSPRLLIADEPTTGLDMTIQAQVLDLIVDVIDQSGASLLLISHDMGVISEICTDVIVMYAGQVMEAGPVDRVLGSPEHPYTQALVECFRAEGGRRLSFIPGRVPDLRVVHTGCPFAPRNPIATQRCWEEAPALHEIAPGHWVACHLVQE